MNRGRLPIVVVLIVSLLAAGIMRSQSTAWVQRESGRTGNSASGAIAGMNSFALALLLGGLRGPLVMFLWSTSESQKNERDLTDFDTKVEWIRLLQPEFDTVHMFEIWNKAYNISVLMASPANKYLTIMQAIEYGRSVLREKPGDLNIISAIGNVYSNKLGGHQGRPEEVFYSRQFREETLTDPARKAAYPDDKSFTRLWPANLLLDESNRIQPQFLEQTVKRKAGAAGGDFNNGSPLQYLARYEPFNYGISPSAMAFNYAKQAQVALTAEGQRPLQLSPMVIDSRPAIELAQWEQEEQTRGRSFEARAFQLPPPMRDASDNDAALAQIPLTARAKSVADLRGAIETFALASRLARDARAEFERHLAHPDYVNRYLTYASHLDDAEEAATMAQADHDYLAALDSSLADAARLRAAAAAGYHAALLEDEKIILKYYVDDAIVTQTYPPHAGRESVGKFTNKQVEETFARAMEASRKNPSPYPNDDRLPYERNVARSQTRLSLLQAG